MNTKEIRAKIERMKNVVALHEKMRNSYFWSSPSHASGRRSYEKNHSDSYQVNLFGTEIELHCETTCSCKNIYYKGHFTVDGKKRNLTAIKNIITAVETIL